MFSKRGTHHEGRHCEGVNITLFYRPAHHEVSLDTIETFRGQTSNSLWLVVRLVALVGQPHDRKVSETSPTISGNQDVVLDEVSISIGVHPTLHLTYRIDAAV